MTVPDIKSFRSAFNGEVFEPTDAGYKQASQIWNASVSKRPKLIARCSGVADVIAAVTFARGNNLLTAIRGGGHNVGGRALCDDGLVIDLSRMRSVFVDPVSRRVRIQGGATLGDIDRETHVFGLAVPCGIVPKTGIGGLTLGGGVGWLIRKYGMSIDNLLSAEIVTADGKVLAASASQNEDLFWALRGGGGNFGVVTSFEFQLHPVGPNVLSGLIVFPFDQAKSVITQFARFTETMPDDLNVWMVTRKAPPLPFLSEKVHGKEIVVLALCYVGNPTEGKKLIEPLRGFGTAHGEAVGVQPFTAWQQAFDPLLTRGARNYWKSHNFTRLSEGAIEAIIEYAGKLPSPQCEIFVGSMGGQTARVAPDAMAYSSRDANYVMNVHGRWESAAEDASVISWAREFFAKSKPFASSGAYINFLTEEETDRIESAYGPVYNRLVALKKKYDPTNFFRMNQNIRPV